MPNPEDTIEFTCNLCGNCNRCALADLKRETRNCTACGSTMRMRAFLLALSDVLFGRTLVLDAFPPSPQLRGIV